MAPVVAAGVAPVVAAGVAPAAVLPPVPVAADDSTSEESSERDEEPKDTILFTAETVDSNIEFDGKVVASLKLQMDVWQPGYGNFNSLMGYWGTIKFQATAEDEWEEIGNIVAWGFSRASTRNPNTNNATFYDDWLQGQASDVKYPRDTLDMAKTLRRLYDPRAAARGNVRELVAAEFQPQLINDGTGTDIMLISRLAINHEKTTAADGTALENPVRASLPFHPFCSSPQHLDAG